MSNFIIVKKRNQNVDYLNITMNGPRDTLYITKRSVEEEGLKTVVYNNGATRLEEPEESSESMLRDLIKLTFLNEVKYYDA